MRLRPAAWSPAGEPPSSAPTPTPRAPRHAPGATAPPGSSPRSRRPRGRPGPPHQVRKVELRSVTWGRREATVRPARAPGPHQAQTGPYLRPRPARLPALTARPAPETGSGRRQTPRKALELLPQPDPLAWDSAPNIRLRARSASPTSRAWAAPSLTPRRPAGRAGPARSAPRGRGKVYPLRSSPYPSNRSLGFSPWSSPKASGVQTLGYILGLFPARISRHLSTHPHP